jgi:hypothetical protein
MLGFYSIEYKLNSDAESSGFMPRISTNLEPENLDAFDDCELGSGKIRLQCFFLNNAQILRNTDSFVCEIAQLSRLPFNPGKA